MKSLIRVAMLVMICLFTMPVFAQDDPIDPDAELTEVFTNADGDITVNYLAGMSITESNYQIFLEFDELSNDYISIATPRAIEFFDIPADTLQTLSESVYNTFIDTIEGMPSYEEALGEVTVGDYEALTITLEGSGVKVVAYIFALDADSTDFFVAILITTETVFTVDIETAIMERIIQTIVVNDVLVAEVTPSPFVEVTPEPLTVVTPEPEFEFVERPAPIEAIEAVELPQTVTLKDGILTVSLPESWVTDGDDMVATTEATFALFDGDDVVPVGDAVLQFSTPTNIKTSPITDINVVSVIEYLQIQLENDLPVYEYSGLPFVAYYMPLDTDRAPENAFFILVKIGEEPDDILGVSGISGDFDADEATLLAIIGSVLYDAELDV
jgi:hypothetical protein